MIKTIIFDVGQVLVHFRWREYIKELGFDDCTERKIAKATVEGCWWKEIDRGMKKEDYEKIIKAANPEIKEELDQFFTHTKSIVEPFDYAEPLIQELKQQGYRVYLLSNYGDFLYKQACHKFTFRNYIDGEVISYQVHSIKPEAKIYQTLLDQYQIQPEQAVFLDDNRDNIKAAKAFGIHAIQFFDLAQTQKELASLGVQISVR